jgi:hypothetical protein
MVVLLMNDETSRLYHDALNRVRICKAGAKHFGGEGRRERFGELEPVDGVGIGRGLDPFRVNLPQ